MKNLVLLLMLVVFSSLSYSQKLNKIGKIEKIPEFPDHRIKKIDGIYKVLKDSFVFEGNTLYKTPKGFITTLETADNKKDFLKKYDSNGELIVTIFSNRIINLKFSSKGNFAAFNNQDNILYVNLNTYEIDTLPSSFVYSFIRDEFIYYNPDKNAIVRNGTNISIDEYPSQIISFKDKILVISKSKIYDLVNNSLILVHEFRGQFFDSMVIDNDFYFVDKVEKRKTESFTLYKTSDFQRILMIDKLDDLNR